MTKQQEIDILSATIAQLGPHSYLGPWLAQIKEELAWSLRVDILPRLSLKDAAADAARVIQDATTAAEQITTKAAKYQDHIKAECQRRLADCTLEMDRAAAAYRAQLHTARRALDSLLER